MQGCNDGFGIRVCRDVMVSAITGNGSGILLGHAGSGSAIFLGMKFPSFGIRGQSFGSKKEEGGGGGRDITRSVSENE